MFSHDAKESIQEGLFTVLVERAGVVKESGSGRNEPVRPF